MHVLSLEQWKDDQVLLRLEHFYQKGEDVLLSQPATVHLQRLFGDFEVLSAKEMTLSAHSPVERLSERLKFSYKAIGNVSTPVDVPVDSSKLVVSLSPMQIRTFILKVKRNN